MNTQPYSVQVRYKADGHSRTCFFWTQATDPADAAAKTREAYGDDVTVGAILLGHHRDVPHVHDVAPRVLPGAEFDFVEPE